MAGARGVARRHRARPDRDAAPPSRRGGEFDRWDLQVCGGMLGRVRMLTRGGGARRRQAAHARPLLAVRRPDWPRGGRRGRRAAGDRRGAARAAHRRRADPAARSRWHPRARRPSRSRVGHRAARPRAPRRARAPPHARPRAAARRRTARAVSGAPAPPEAAALPAPALAAVARGGRHARLRRPGRPAAARGRSRSLVDNVLGDKPVPERARWRCPASADRAALLMWVAIGTVVIFLDRDGRAGHAARSRR